MKDTRTGRRYSLMTAAFAAWMLILLPLSVHAQEVQPAARAEDADDIIFVGDSRFVQMKNAVGENPYLWIAKGSQGYDWFSGEAVAQIDAAVQSGTKILINFGVNDVGNEKSYAELVNRKAAEWEEKGAEVYYASVNPVEDGRYVTEEKVEKFNEKLQEDLNSAVEWIDSFSWLMENGYTLTDGLHFSSDTYEKLYAFYLDELMDEN